MPLSPASKKGASRSTGRSRVTPRIKMIIKKKKILPKRKCVASVATYREEDIEADDAYVCKRNVDLSVRSLTVPLLLSLSSVSHLPSSPLAISSTGFAIDLLSSLCLSTSLHIAIPSCLHILPNTGNFLFWSYLMPAYYMRGRGPSMQNTCTRILVLLPLACMV